MLGLQPIPATPNALPVRWLHPQPGIARRRFPAAGHGTCCVVALAASAQRKVQRASVKGAEVQHVEPIREIFQGVDFPEEMGGRQRIENALWLAWRRMGNPRPPAKEIKEIFAFFNACSKQVGQRRILIDAAGGHGGIALAFRAFRKVERAVVVDLYEPQSFEKLRAAWLPDESPSVVQFRPGDISEVGWLSTFLEKEEVDPSEVMLVACHACSILSDELIRECVRCQVEFAIMPCCQGEESRKGMMMLNTAKNLNLPHGLLVDIARLGVIEESPGYKASMKRIDENITPQNRILIGLRETAQDVARRAFDRQRFLRQMAKKYRHISWRREENNLNAF